VDPELFSSDEKGEHWEGAVLFPAIVELDAPAAMLCKCPGMGPQ